MSSEAVVWSLGHCRRALSKLYCEDSTIRSSLYNDMLSALLVLASEKDLLAGLSNILVLFLVF